MGGMVTSGHMTKMAVILFGLTSENITPHANFMALPSTEVELLLTKVFCGGNTEFALFCYCDHDLDPTTFIHELDPYPLISLQAACPKLLLLLLLSTKMIKVA